MGRSLLTSNFLPDVTTLTFSRHEGNFPLNTASLKRLANIGDTKSVTNLNTREGISFNSNLINSKESISLLTSSETLTK